MADCAQQASLFLYGHGRAAFPFLLLILLSVIPDSGPAMPYFWRYKKSSILIPASLELTEILRTCTLHVLKISVSSSGAGIKMEAGFFIPSKIVVALPSLQVSLQVQVLHWFVRLEFWFRLSLIHFQQVGFTIFYLPSSWLMLYCCLIICSFYGLILP